MAAVALDQFDAVLGSRRGGGRSHTVLPAVGDAASFNAAIAALCQDPGLAASAAGREAIEALESFAAEHFNGSAPGERSRSMLLALGIPTNVSLNLAGKASHVHIAAVISGERALAADPADRAQYGIASLTAYHLAAQVMSGPGMNKPPKLARLLGPDAIATLDITADGRRYLELHGEGELLVADKRHWARIFTAALEADSESTAANVLANSYATEIVKVIQR